MVRYEVLDECQSLFGFVLAATEHHEVIGVSHKAKTVFMEVPVEHVQSDVGQQRRSQPSNDVAKTGLSFHIVLPRSRLKPTYGEGSRFKQDHTDKEVT